MSKYQYHLVIYVRNIFLVALLTLYYYFIIYFAIQVIVIVIFVWRVLNMFSIFIRTTKDLMYDISWKKHSSVLISGINE